jgi:hypothetical protein
VSLVIDTVFVVPVAMLLKCSLLEARIRPCDVTLARFPDGFANTGKLPSFMAAADLIVLLVLLALPL